VDAIPIIQDKQKKLITDVQKYMTQFEIQKEETKKKIVQSDATQKQIIDTFFPNLVQKHKEAITKLLINKNNPTIRNITELCEKEKITIPTNLTDLLSQIAETKDIITVTYDVQEKIQITEEVQSIKLSTQDEKNREMQQIMKKINAEITETSCKEVL
jgi:hypothetical protein